MHQFSDDPSVGVRSEAALRVIVLAGGPGAERAVSLESGRAIAGALRRRGHEVLLRDVGPDNLAVLDERADVFFPIVHGDFGEDGRLQREMEQRGLKFVGSDSAASELAMDKVRTKQAARDLGIATPAYAVIDTRLSDASACAIEPPAVVKPTNQGSSVLISIARDADALTAAVNAVVDAYGSALVERFIGGREVTVGILDNEALPPIWIRPKAAFYDYQAKYQDDATEYRFDTGLNNQAIATLQDDSRRLCRAIGCRHLARADWIVDDDQHGWILEVNTLPGFTSHSLLPKAAAKHGCDFDELCDRLARLALRGR